jgi:hypothetical protein
MCILEVFGLPLIFSSIVAVHGIGAHPDDTWTGRGPTSKVNWLIDPEMLPKAIPEARIMRFGYESAWVGDDRKKPKKTYVSDVAKLLLEELENYRDESPSVYTLATNLANERCRVSSGRSSSSRIAMVALSFF